MVWCMVVDGTSLLVNYQTISDPGDDCPLRVNHLMHRLYDMRVLMLKGCVYNGTKNNATLGGLQRQR